jgi:CRP-like cAMP-binding protein
MLQARPQFGNAFLDGLTAADLREIQPHLVVRDLRRDLLLHEEGDTREDLYFPAGAILSVITLMADGRGVECRTVGRESAYGLTLPFGSRIAHNRLLVQVPGRCVQMPAQRLRSAALRSLSLVETLARHLQGGDANTEQSVACNALHDVEARLCRWILMSADRTDDQPLPLTQEALAFMLGVQRTTVTAVARSLQEAGLISYRRGEITLRDRKGLEEAACECYAAARQKFRQMIGSG